MPDKAFNLDDAITANPPAATGGGFNLDDYISSPAQVKSAEQPSTQNVEAKPFNLDDAISSGGPESDSAQAPAMPTADKTYLGKINDIWGSDENFLEKLYDTANTNVLDLRGVGEKNPDADTGIGWGALHGVEDLASGFTSPLQLGLMLGTAGAGSLIEKLGVTAVTEGTRGAQIAYNTAKVAGKLVNAGFTVQMLHSAIDAYPQMSKYFEDGDYGKAMELGVQFVAGAAGGLLSAGHLASSMKEDINGLSPVTKADVIDGMRTRELKAATDHMMQWNSGLKRAVKAPLDREALSFYGQAQGNTDILGKWIEQIQNDPSITAKGLKDQTLAALHRAIDLKVDVVSKIEDLRQHYAHYAERASAVDEDGKPTLYHIMDGSSTRDNYFSHPHWQGKEGGDIEAIDNINEDMARGGNTHTHRRVYNTIVDGLLNGEVPEKNANTGRYNFDAVDLASDYGMQMENAMSNRAFATRLIHGMHEDGTPFASKAGYAVPVEGYARDTDPDSPTFGQNVATGGQVQLLSADGRRLTPITKKQMKLLSQKGLWNDLVDEGRVKLVNGAVHADMRDLVNTAAKVGADGKVVVPAPKTDSAQSATPDQTPTAKTAEALQGSATTPTAEETQEPAGSRLDAISKAYKDAGDEDVLDHILAEGRDRGLSDDQLAQTLEKFNDESNADPTNTMARITPETSPSLREFLKNSVIKEPLYHGSTKDFHFFDPERASHTSVGIHMGTLEQAHDFVNNRVNGKIYQVYTNITNPLRLKDHFTWHPQDVLGEMEDKGLTDARPLPKEYAEGEGIDIHDGSLHDGLKVYVTQGLQKLGYTPEEIQNPSIMGDFDRQEDLVRLERRLGTQYVIDVLKHNGYDGIVYKNMGEGEVPEDSYVALDPSQVKSATGNNGDFDTSKKEMVARLGSDEGKAAAGEDEVDPKFKELAGDYKNFDRHADGTNEVAKMPDGNHALMLQQNEMHLLQSMYKDYDPDRFTLLGRPLDGPEIRELQSKLYDRYIKKGASQGDAGFVRGEPNFWGRVKDLAKKADGKGVNALFDKDSRDFIRFARGDVKVNDPNVQVEQVVDRFGKIKYDNDMIPLINNRETAMELHKYLGDLRDKMPANGEGTMLIAKNGSSPEELAKTYNEERLHGWQTRFSKGDFTKHLSRDNFKKAYAAIPQSVHDYLAKSGYTPDRPMRVVESAAKLMSGQMEDMGATPEESAQFLDKYLDLVEQEHGVGALREITNAVGFAKDMLAERLKKDAERVSDEGRDTGVPRGEEEWRGGGYSEALARKAGQESTGTAEPTEGERAGEVENGEELTPEEEESADEKPPTEDTKEKAPKYAFDTSAYKVIKSPYTRTSITTPRGEKLMTHYAFSPSVYKLAKEVLAPEKTFLQKHPKLNAVMHASSEVKQTMLSASGFHWVQIGLRGVQSGVNPLKPLVEMYKGTGGWKMNDRSSPEFIPQAKLIEARGITPGIQQGEAFSRNALKAHGGLLNKIPGIGRLLGDVNQALFGPNGYIDRMKLNAALDFEKRLRKYYPGQENEMARYKLAGELANQRFGGLNYAAMGRDKNVQDTLRMTLLAPDWFEGNMRDVLGLVSGPGSHLVRQDFARIALYNFGVAQTLNLLTTGKMQPQQPFGVVSPDGKKVYSVRTLPTDLFHALANPREYISYRLNPLIGRTGLELLTGRDSKGRIRTLSQQILDMLENSAPMSAHIGVEKMFGDTRPGDSATDSILSAAGVTSRGNLSPAEELAYKLASEYSTSGKMPSDEAAHFHRVIGYEDRLRNGDKSAMDDARNDLAKGVLKPYDFKQIASNAGKSRLESVINRLPMADSIDVWNLANNAEREQMSPVMLKKIMDFRKTEPLKYTANQRNRIDTRIAAVVGNIIDEREKRLPAQPQSE